MDTTKLIVEYLVGGTLIVVATFLAVASWFSGQIQEMIDSPIAQQTMLATTFANQVILATLFLSLAYGIGIVFEYVGDWTFDWLMIRIKAKRIPKYILENRGVLKESPIFSPFVYQSKNPTDTQKLVDCVGKMRFFVMEYSDSLYAEIAAQVSRFRLIRVLFLAEVIIAIAVVGQFRNGVSLFMFTLFVLIIGICVANFMAIRSRFSRYCRAVERSYLVLMYDKFGKENIGDGE